MSEITIATCQFTSGNDTGANMRRMAELIDQAAAAGAQLVAFQEFCNHPAYYSSQDHAWQAALGEDDEFLRVVTAKAAERGVHVSFNATVRAEWPRVIDQNFLVSDQGKVILTSHKQVLMGSERDYFAPGTHEAEIVDTPLGRIGIMSCMEGLIPENPRVLAVKGAQLILNSLSSNGLDEAHTHIPVRAAENGVHVVSANRAGPLVDVTDLELLTAKNGIPVEKLIGGGESQIVNPLGVSLVRAQAHVDDMVITTVDVADTHGVHLLAQRRPELYGALVAPVDSHQSGFGGRNEPGNPTVVLLSPVAGLTGVAAVDDVLATVGCADADLLVLPELFATDVAGLRSGADVDREQISDVVSRLVEFAQQHDVHVVAGLPGHTQDGHTTNATALFAPDGTHTWYHQVHVHPEDANWATPGTEWVHVDLPFGRVGLLTGHDLLFPEATRILALAGVDLVAIPGTWRQEWEHRLAVTERSSENHVAVAVAARADSPVAHPHVLTSTPTDYLFPLTGEVNMPERREAAAPGEALVAQVALAPSRDKLLMRRTDVIADRQPALYGALVDSSLVPGRDI